MQGLILAAGMGLRLGVHTKENTKCMLDVNGKKLIQRQINALNNLGIKKIIIVTGYKKENLEKYVTENFKDCDIIFVENNDYKTTNNIYSLFLAKEYLNEDDTILLESDLIFEEGLLEKLIKSKDENVVAVSKYKTWMDGTVTTIDNNCIINGLYSKNEFNIKEADNYYKTINVYKLSKEFCKNEYVPSLEKYIFNNNKNCFYEDVFKSLIKNKNSELKAMVFDREKWYEIDTPQDLDIAKCLFDYKAERYQKRYGGYWRFDNLKDFCYLENPKFPSKELMYKINSFSENLITKYPSGMDVQNLNATMLFNIEQDEIIVGNGAAELIKELGNLINEKITVNIPVFNEYNRCFKKCKIIKNDTSENDYFYNKDTIIKNMNESEAIVLVNPDNPSGNFIEYKDMIDILRIAKEKSIKVIVDESFVDFADEDKKYTLINHNLLKEYKNLVVIKSISKSYGVPGIRLGVLASGNKEIIKKIKNNLGIWNINSIAEYFLQIMYQYNDEYEKACKYIEKERKRMYNELNKLTFLSAYKSQANYFMCKLKDNLNSTYITEYLLKNYNIFIKDLKGKEGFDKNSYIRIAIKSEKENEELINALRDFENKRND